MFITREFTFDAAHFVTNYYGKCERMHGHTYKLQITIGGDIQKNGMVIDFVIFKRIVQKHILEKLDHYLLNDIIENPTAENIAIWIWDHLKNLHQLLLQEIDDPNLSEEIKTFLKKTDQPEILQQAETKAAVRLHEIKLWETPNVFVTYQGK